jgi:hypothetical protein
MSTEEPATAILPDPPTHKSCKVCGEDIRASAKKCIQCDSYQDLRGGLGISATVLSLLIALVSVLTTAATVFDSAFANDRSYLDFSFQGADTSTLAAFVINSGSRPGTLHGAEVRARVGGDLVTFGLISMDMAVNNGRIIRPQSADQVIFLSSGTATNGGTAVGQDCTFSIFLTNFNSETERVTKSIDCDRVRDFAASNYEKPQ